MPKHNKKSDKPAKLRYNAQGHDAVNKARKQAKHTRMLEQHALTAREPQKLTNWAYWKRELNRARSSLIRINNSTKPNAAHADAAVTRARRAEYKLEELERERRGDLNSRTDRVPNEMAASVVSRVGYMA